MNPLRSSSSLPFGAIPFDKIENNHFLPALHHSIESCRKSIAQIEKITDPTFDNVIIGLEKCGRELSETSAVFFNLTSAETNKEIEAQSAEYSQLISQFSNEIALNEKLFAQVNEVYKNTDKSTLSPEQKTLLEKTFKGFARNGALLPEKKKNELKEIDQKLATIKVKYGQNVLAETNAYLLLVDTVEELNGLPPDAIQTAKDLATQKGSPEKWAFSLQMPSYQALVTYAENRKLREEIFRAYASRSFQNNEFNNAAICNEIAQLRKKRAQLLGYKSHAEYVLEERMAKSPLNVQAFLEDLLKKSLHIAKEQVNEVSVFAAEQCAPLPLQRWDFGFWAEKLKKEKYSIDDELLKPYFVLGNVLNGAFLMAQKLYGLSFKENKDLAAYHKDVTVYEVYESNGDFLALFYADFFPREGKRAGAWMTSYKNQYVENGVDHRPHISIVCNFNKPVGDKPSLLTFQEVTTLFHEFGHALHGMCAKGEFAELSGTNVFWDFVELPSQMHENWCYEKECLDLFAFHYQTGELIPMELVQKVAESSKYLEGYQTVRQLNFGMLDLAWHHSLNAEVMDIAAFEQNVLGKTALLPGVEGICSSTAFQHIFNGGYSAGYYSYKWAEVLDADAFEAFKEKGIFNAEVGQRFKENILEKGGSENPSILYKRFRGKEPNNEALLKRAGLK